MSDDPLSEELEAKIRPLWDVLWERAIREQNDEARDDLRAFAREIQKPLEKLKADAKASQARTYSYAQAAERADDEVAAAESALLASQESARQLAEALDWYGRGIVSVQSEEHVHGMHGLGNGRDPECPMCDDGRKAREAVLAYRSSEAGKEKV